MKLKGTILKIEGGKQSEMGYCYDLDNADERYLFGEGKDGGVGFCLKAIGLYAFYKEHKSDLGYCAKEIERLNSWGSNIAPMDIHQERQWLLAYGELTKKLVEIDKILLVETIKKENRELIEFEKVEE